ncbi:hypothetical protein [Streptomyces sp. NPDC046759]
MNLLPARSSSTADAVATVVTLPLRALARLSGGASSTARGSRA